MKTACLPSGKASGQSLLMATTTKPDSTSRISTQETVRAAWLDFGTCQLVVLGAGGLLIGPRLYAAFSSTSVGLAADALQDLVELAFGLLVYLSLQAARRSSALLFPHGTGKFETIANGLLALSLLFSGTGIVIVGAGRLMAPVLPEQTSTAMVLLTVTMSVNATVYVLSRPLVNSHGTVIRIWRQALLIDVLMKAATLAFVFAAEFGGLLIYFDGLAAVLIGMAMLWLAVRALKDSVWELSDRALEEEVQLDILRSLANKMQTFDDLLDVRTRRVAGRPVIEIVAGFGHERSWPYVIENCEALRREIQANVHGARVSVFPADAKHYQPCSEDESTPC